MVFPNNNLPSDAKYWVREVEKKIVNLESSLSSSDINNTTRDSQLQVTASQALIAAQAADAAATEAGLAADAAADAAQDALDAIDAANAASSLANDAQDDALAALQDIIDLGNPGGPSIYANNISGGTISGVTLVSSSGSNTVTINNGAISFNSSGNTGAINPNSSWGLGLVSSNVVYVSAPNGIEGAAASFGEIDGLNIDAQGTLRRSALSGGGTTGASITDGGYIVRTSSSKRYKTDIEPLKINLNDLYQVEPKTFKRIEEVEQSPETARTYPGFIAEELAGTSLDKFVFYSKDEEGNPRPEGIHYPELTAALLIAVKDLNARIEALETN
jgi:hypothetical protein